MKKLNLFLIAIIGLITLVSAHGYNGHGNNNSDLNLRLWNQSTFRVVFNNQTFARSNRFDLANIKPGIHHIQVVKQTPNKYGHGGLKRVLYNGTIKVPRNSEVRAVITPHRTLKLKVIKKWANHHQNNHGHQSGCGFDKGYACSCNEFDGHGQLNNDFDGHQQGCGFNNGYSCSCNEFDDFGYTNGNGFGNPYGPFYGNGPQIMSQPSFDHLHRVIENTTFDDSKLVIAKQAIRDNNFSTEQIGVLMSSFNFDSYRLKLAKLAYDKTVDKENYFMINELLSFISSIRELDHYISKYG